MAIISLTYDTLAVHISAQCIDIVGDKITEGCILECNRNVTLKKTLDYLLRYPQIKTLKPTIYNVACLIKIFPPRIINNSTGERVLGNYDEIMLTTHVNLPGLIIKSPIFRSIELTIFSVWK